VSKKRKAEEKVQSDKPAAKKAAVEDESVNKTMYIRGLPWKTTEDEVRDFFISCGEIEHLELPLQDDGRSSGTAIIKFATVDACEACIQMNGQDFNGRWVHVKYSTPKPITAPRERTEKPEGCKTVFVGNLSWNIDEETLRSSFAECGEISEIRFAEDKETGDFKGYGHIEFVDSESTDKAIEMAGTEVLGRPLRVDYAADKRKQFGGGGRGGGGGGR
jgi:RNA-binding proteins (RRM domain)